MTIRPNSLYDSMQVCFNNDSMISLWLSTSSPLLLYYCMYIHYLESLLFFLESFVIESFIFNFYRPLSVHSATLFGAFIVIGCEWNQFTFFLGLNFVEKQTRWWKKYEFPFSTFRQLHRCHTAPTQRYLSSEEKFQCAFFLFLKGIGLISEVLTVPISLKFRQRKIGLNQQHQWRKNWLSDNSSRTPQCVWRNAFHRFSAHFSHLFANVQSSFGASSVNWEERCVVGNMSSEPTLVSAVWWNWNGGSVN